MESLAADEAVAETAWTMRHTRIIVTHYGGPDALQVLEEECPEPKAGEVRVKMQAAGVSIPKRPGCPTRRGGIWSEWWTGSVPAPRESNRARSSPRCRSTA